MSFGDKLLANRLEVIEELDKIMQSINSGYKVKGVNNSSSVVIEGCDIINIYIRLEWNSDETIRVNFSNVDIGKRRAGIFSSIIQGIIESNVIKSATISSVITDEMHNFCKKHNMVCRESFDSMIKDYVVKESINE